MVQLGISPIYHMREVGKNKHQDLWVQVLEAKYENKGKAWEREDFEQILAGFEVRITLTSHMSPSPVYHAP